METEVLGGGLTGGEQSVSIPEVVSRMAASGLHPESIAQILQISPIQVKTIILQLPPVQHPDEVKIAEKTRALINMALDEARDMLDNGAEDTKLALVKAFVGGAIRTLGRSEDTETDETRAAVERIFKSNREIPSAIPVD